MKQLVLRNGQPQVVQVPAPSPSPGFVLVANAASVVSSGTERSAVAFGAESLLGRAIRNPDLVLKTLGHARERGIKPTIELVRRTVSADGLLGYSSAGRILDTGGVASFQVGQRVACAGAGHANHAEVVSVPGNLVSAALENISLTEVAFTTLGAIAVQGVRRATVTLGERVVVVGLGLLGLLTVQILRAAGCRVVGVEPIEARRALAAGLGTERTATPQEAGASIADWTGGLGADAAIVTAASKSDTLVNDAVELLRHKGRLVLVGDVGLGLDRRPLYEREADVLISTSYGPGRYDPTYEELGVDYPFAYVRWTENRNMGEFLRLLANRQVLVRPLVELELPVERAAEAYAALGRETPPLAAVLTYAEREAGPELSPEVVRVSRERTRRRHDSEIVVAIIGAGEIVRGMHVPTLKAAQDVRVKTVVARRGTSAAEAARSLASVKATTDWRLPLADPEVDLVLVATRHDTHAAIAAAALRAGKAVFLEKPLGLSREEIDEVWEAGLENDRLAIGFNRPFSQLAARLGEEVLAVEGPIHLAYRVNAPLAPDHWLNDPREGGGRILGEACHMFDFANWLCGLPETVYAAGLPARPNVHSTESATVTVQYGEGSVATVLYSAVGSGSMPKERIEVLRHGRSWVLDDFSTLTSFGPDGTRTQSVKRQDKGHSALLLRALDASRGKAPFEPGLEAAYLAQSVALAALESIAAGNAVKVVLP